MKDDKVLQVSPDVHWIGILDFDIVTFDVVMETQFGTTYNSYFINAEKKTIIETSKEKFVDTYLNKVKQVVNPEEIEYIILNHTEPDHSGNLKHLLEIAPNATVVGSGNALRYLEDIVCKPFKSIKVKDGDTLDLGNKTLRFISAPNLHWPDSIYTYLEEDKLLFTCDSFGAHFAHEEMFDDKVGNYDEAFKYYFDVILKPFSKFMLKAIDKISELEISAICPGHGPILRSHWKRIVDLSKEYAEAYISDSNPAKARVFIPYVSAYGYTRDMARTIQKGIESVDDVEVELLDIEHSTIGELDARLTHSNGIIVGCPTINQNILLPIYKLFSVINPLRDKGKLAGTFGSYGWSGEGVKIMEENLKNLKLNFFQQGLTAKFQPHNGETDQLFNYGQAFAKRILSYQYF
ncbi:MAG: FprA family A-type flavoprotein [Bacteroidales bacterium]|nr:FprA family A-type flavoprotein [Bacteroidales bacterium]MCF8456971.1 FprA family A-type flavoprotein [Bacteroidales bacterium]